VIIGADNSESMLKVATRPTSGCGETGTAFADICIRYRFADNSVDSISACACCTTLVIRAQAGDIAEFQRVTRDSVIISLWVDGNFKAWKRKRLENRRKKVSRKVTKTGLCYRLLLLKQSLSKPVSCSGIPGLHPLYAMWRVYVLRKR
jgi:hypothetical protein